VLPSRTDQLSFGRPRQLPGEWDGNLGALRKLEDTGFISVPKACQDRRVRAGIA
jgi:hypothetical protein